MIPVYLGLGANLGHCIKTLQNVCTRLAFYQIDSCQMILKKSSSIYTSPPYQGADQAIYYNQVLLVHTNFSAFELLQVCLKIEEEFGRKRTSEKHWESRTIDIDILYYGSEVINNATLQIPHYDIVNRAFFLQPLCEISPQWQDPHLKCSASEIWQTLLQNLPANQIPQKLENSC